MDVNDGCIFLIINCHCLLNIATIVVWADDVINLDGQQRQWFFHKSHTFERIFPSKIEPYTCYEQEIEA